MPGKSGCLAVCPRKTALAKKLKPAFFWIFANFRLFFSRKAFCSLKQFPGFLSVSQFTYPDAFSRNRLTNVHFDTLTAIVPEACRPGPAGAHLAFSECKGREFGQISRSGPGRSKACPQRNKEAAKICALLESAVNWAINREGSRLPLCLDAAFLRYFNDLRKTPANFGQARACPQSRKSASGGPDRGSRSGLAARLPTRLPKQATGRP